MEKNGKYSPFKIFFIFSVIANTIILYWIPNVMIEYGRMNLFIGISGLIILVTFISLFFALSGILIKKSLNTGIISFLLIPSVWISKDLILEKIFGGFPWCFAGYSQYRNILFIQPAEFGGIYMVTFFLILFNLLLYKLLKERDKISFIMFFAIFIFYHLIGLLLYLKDSSLDRAMPFHKAGIIQPDTGQNFSSKKRWRRITLKELFNESESLKNKGAEFVVWPEFTLPLYPLQNRTVLNTILKFTDTTVPVFAGFTDFKNSNEVYNSMILFDRNNRIKKYDKTHLVPYGEYILFKDILFFIKKITNEVSEFTPGKDIHNIELEGHLIATPICYELIYPELVKSFITKGGELITIISNDSWYGTSSAPYQLLSMATVRAVENRRYILRSTSNGISALINTSGIIKKSIPLNRKDSFIAPFKFRSGKTFYVRIGYIFPYIFLVFISIFFLFVKFRELSSN